ncbi:hypothetical protein [Kitasatospora sp. LaBMicrA B282]|uniref:hypothetical protein n=1 Tax=Kitasatospora sp. LaBMicrA B282 TaxID=3420949 RepID=UPI003D0DA680
MNQLPKKPTPRPARRVVWSAAAVTAVAAVGLTAFTLAPTAPAAARTATPGHLVAMAPPSTFPTQTAPPTQPPAPTQPAPATPTPARSTTPSPTASQPPSPTPSPTAPPHPFPLPAAQLPAPAAEQWTPTGHPATRPVAGHDITENECAKVHGATAWSQQAYAGGTGGNNPAVQDTFTFADPAAAQAAYQGAVTGMSTCQATTRALQTANRTTPDATVTQTSTRPGATAWQRTWTGVRGLSAQGPQTNHLYLAVGGNTLVVLQFTELPGNATPYDTAADPQTLTQLAAELTAH